MSIVIHIDLKFAKLAFVILIFTKSISMGMPILHEISLLHFYYLTEFTILYFLSSPSIPLMWALLIIMLVLLRLAYDVSFASSYIFLNNSVTPDKLGSINGLAGSLTAFFR